MSTTKNLRGFLPARKRGSGSNSTGFDELPIASGDARSMFTGDLVKTSLGNVEPVSADADYADGVFMGCHYVANGVPTYSKYWPANTSATDIKAFVRLLPIKASSINQVAITACSAPELFDCITSKAI